MFSLPRMFSSPGFTQLILMLQGLHSANPSSVFYDPLAGSDPYYAYSTSFPLSQNYLINMYFPPSDCSFLKVGCQYWVPGGRTYLVNEPAVHSLIFLG